MPTVPKNLLSQYWLYQPLSVFLYTSAVLSTLLKKKNWNEPHGLDFKSILFSATWIPLHPHGPTQALPRLPAALRPHPSPYWLEMIIKLHAVSPCILNDYQSTNSEPNIIIWEDTFYWKILNSSGRYQRAKTTGPRHCSLSFLDGWLHRIQRQILRPGSQGITRAQEPGLRSLRLGDLSRRTCAEICVNATQFRWPRPLRFTMVGYSSCPMLTKT